MKLALTCAAALLLTAAAPVASPAATPTPSAPVRPAEDVARDPTRKPGAVLAFLGLKPGDKVADFVMGGGYLTRVLAAAVGQTGRVYAYQPAEFVKFKASYGEAQDRIAATYPNVTAIRTPFAAVSFPEKLDAIVTVQNYHDLHLKPFPADTAQKVDAALFAALKPGGTLVVIDHVAAPGSGLAAPDKLHRIDPAITIRELEAAGFRFEARDETWHDPADPHTANVFDPAIRGHTDQFAFRFRKPG